ncbi:MAG: hypothetical protein Q8862_10015 [Bacteroidota bacterium]|nr:hypothetical protein [Bacteroidota bacterium]
MKKIFSLVIMLVLVAGIAGAQTPIITKADLKKQGQELKAVAKQTGKNIKADCIKQVATQKNQVKNAYKAKSDSAKAVATIKTAAKVNKATTKVNKAATKVNKAVARVNNVATQINNASVK